MRTSARARRATVAVVTALLLLTAWTAVAERSLPDQAMAQSSAAVGNPVHHQVSETFGAVEIEHAVIVASPATGRLVDPRLSPVWALAALAAALFALSSLRRRNDRPTFVARTVLLRGSVARRAPPLASFA